MVCATNLETAGGADRHATDDATERRSFVTYPETARAATQPNATHDVDPDLKLDRQEARQGKTGLNVRYVLAISLAAAILAMALIYTAGTA
ncbi:hypothetical protein GCM10011587_08610 [Pyruvatibacter mobilis]|jgi:hypothetical protein|nr:hypothetical protein GCM10011587_08610 [Pyruvatibacter mobilis]